MPPARAARHVHPLLGLWALLIAAVLTYAGARINQAVIQVLFDSAGPRVNQPHAPSANARIVVDA